MNTALKKAKILIKKQLLQNKKIHSYKLAKHEI